MDWLLVVRDSVMAQRLVELFNAKVPIGTAVRYYPLAGNPEHIETQTRSEAWLSASGHGLG